MTDGCDRLTQRRCVICIGTRFAGNKLILFNLKK